MEGGYVAAVTVAPTMVAKITVLELGLACEAMLGLGFIAAAIIGLASTSLRMFDSVEGTKGRVMGMED